jgi:hypothetical protein
VIPSFFGVNVMSPFPQKALLYPLLLLILNFPAFGNSNTQALLQNGQWSPISEKNGIKIYKKKLLNSPLLALRAIGDLESSIETLLTIFRDIEGSLEWAPRLKKRTILKNISESEAIIYEIRGLPWPCKNRDLVLHNKLHFDKKKKALILRTQSVNNFPKDPGSHKFIRAQLFYSAVSMKPLSKKKTRVEIIIHVDPKGNIPDWLVNFFQKNWPYKFLKRMEKRSRVVTPNLGPELKKFVSDLYLTRPYR